MGTGMERSGHSRQNRTVNGEREGSSRAGQETGRGG